MLQQDKISGRKGKHTCSESQPDPYFVKKLFTFALMLKNIILVPVLYLSLAAKQNT
jgi:hypothetical protein